jgi:hypothetical protein
MKKFDRLFIGFLLGGTFPLFLGQLSLLVWLYFNGNENRALYFVLSGLLIGLAVDIMFLRKWIAKRYAIAEWITAGIYIFYSITLYGIFMGFPVFNLLMGLPAGYYYGKRIQFTNDLPEKNRFLIRKISVFTGLVMALFCISSGFIALRGSGVGPDIRSVFRLPFEVTKPMLLIAAVTGGILLIYLQIVITKVTLIKTIRYL